MKFRKFAKLQRIPKTEEVAAKIYICIFSILDAVRFT